MRRRLFLYGEIGCGKSTMIRSVLGQQIKAAGGFVTQRIIENEKLLGFELLAASLLPEIDSEEKGKVFISFSDKLLLDKNVFSEYAVNLLCEAYVHDFAVLDEIGGVELLKPQFRKALYDFLESKVPCIGVLKTEESAKKLQERLSMENDYRSTYEKLLEFLKKDPDTLLVKMTGRGDMEAYKQVKAWAQEYAEEKRLICGNYMKQ